MWAATAQPNRVRYVSAPPEAGAITGFLQIKQNQNHFRPEKNVVAAMMKTTTQIIYDEKPDWLTKFLLKLLDCKLKQTAVDSSIRME